MGKDTKVLDKIRKFGGYMSGMVMPNLGAFVGWGLLAALFIPTGWMPNEKLNEMVGPILNYLLPLLIGYSRTERRSYWSIYNNGCNCWF